MNKTLAICGCCNLLAAIYCACFGLTAGAGILMAGAVLLLGLTKMGDIEMLKAGNLVARAQKVIKEAEVSLEAVQNLAINFSELMLEQIKHSPSGFWSDRGLSPEQREESFQKVMDGLNQFNVPKEKAAKVAEEVWYPYVEEQYLACITGLTRSQDEKKWNAFMEELNKIHWPTITIPRLEELLRAHEVFTPEASLALEDFKYYRTHRRHKNFSRYISGTSAYLKKA